MSSNGRKEPREYLTAHEAAKVLRCSRSTVFRWVREGRLRRVHRAGRTFFRRRDVDRLWSSPR